MTSLSDILFPSQDASLASSNNINRILGDLKRSTLSITNRLRSIQQDAAFVDEVRAALGGANKAGRPLVANERCGSWYIRPEVKGGSAYFKSTDGHTGQWRFSTRRLNLHLLPMIERFDGIIIVDSTRRGKRMPDALSKTIPMWCCVLNRVLFPDQPAHHDLHVPPNAVSASEHSQMRARVPGGVAALQQLKLDLAALRAQLTKPLRPTWVTPESQTDLLSPPSHDAAHDDHAAPPVIFADYRPVVCCTSSARVPDGEISGHGAGYIQGAGDDTENWAHGLTPPVFWAHADELLAAPETDLPARIEQLVRASAPAPSASASASASLAPGDATDADLPPTVRRLTPYLYVSPLPLPAIPKDSSSAPAPWCRIALLPKATPSETWVQSPTQLNVGLGKHKVASRNLRVALASICDFVTRYLEAAAAAGSEQKQQQTRILVACETGGRDLAIGVALALLCWCFVDDDGQCPRVVQDSPETTKTCKEGDRDEKSKSPSSVQEPISFNKTMIKVRLGRIMTAMPDANPHRATLQSVNSFLMDWRK